RGDDFLRYFRRRANCEAVVIADDFFELFLAEADLHIDFDAAFLENVDSRWRKFIGNEDFGSHGDNSFCNGAALAGENAERARLDFAMCFPGPAGQAAFGRLVRAVSNAQSSQGVSASRSERSTVEPVQILRPGGASR